MKQPPQYGFTWVEVVWVAAVLVIFFSIAGWPHGLLDWTAVGAGLMLGNLVFHRTRRRRR